MMRFFFSGNEAELIFTRSVTSSEDACKEMERLLVRAHHMFTRILNFILFIIIREKLGFSLINNSHIGIF